MKRKRIHDSDWRPIEFCHLHRNEPNQGEHNFVKQLSARLDGIAAIEVSMLCGCRYLDLEQWYLRRWHNAMKGLARENGERGGGEE